MLMTFQSHTPQLASGVFVTEDAVVLGQVNIGAHSSVWYGCVVRGDVNTVTIGERTNIQDRTVVHVTSERFPTTVGHGVTVGHAAILHGCTVGDDVLVGMGAILLDDVEVLPGSVVAAGSVLPPGKRYPQGVLIMGSPARVVREVRSEEREQIKESATHYMALAEAHRGAVRRVGHR